MKKVIPPAVCFLSCLFILSACGGGTTPGLPVAVYTSPPAVPTRTPTPVYIAERLSHVDMTDPSLTADYLFRSFIQIPVGVAWGPDDMLYMADWHGQHVVRMAKDYFFDDLPFCLLYTSPSPRD